MWDSWANIGALTFIVAPQPSKITENMNTIVIILIRLSLSIIVRDEQSHLVLGERGGLVVNASDSGSRGRGFEPHSGQTVLCP